MCEWLKVTTIGFGWNGMALAIWCRINGRVSFVVDAIPDCWFGNRTFRPQTIWAPSHVAPKPSRPRLEKNYLTHSSLNTSVQQTMPLRPHSLAVSEREREKVRESDLASEIRREIERNSVDSERYFSSPNNNMCECFSVMKTARYITWYFIAIDFKLWKLNKFLKDFLCYFSVGYIYSAKFH